jgi:hypothetical protein
LVTIVSFGASSLYDLCLAPDPRHVVSGSGDEERLREVLRDAQDDARNIEPEYLSMSNVGFRPLAGSHAELRRGSCGRG